MAMLSLATLTSTSLELSPLASVDVPYISLFGYVSTGAMLHAKHLLNTDPIGVRLMGIEC